jgi:hypothetical protein
VTGVLVPDLVAEVRGDRHARLPNKFDGKFAVSCVVSTDLSGNKRTDHLGHVFKPLFLRHSLEGQFTVEVAIELLERVGSAERTVGLGPRGKRLMDELLERRSIESAEVVQGVTAMSEVA